ncbi:hypothetical protein [Compostibacter hankyongensis]|uniref:Tetratricopeptide repeat protein n=1 Tax=Compostibacter hankyongensis TaxID=1007089 RepID=A0ABP8FK49_9BACT
MYTKKLSGTLLLLLGFGTVALAQNKNVNKAESALKDGKLAEARDLINPATTDSKTGDKAKTWYLKGQIYAAIAADSAKSVPVDHPGDTALAAFQQCLKLDPKFTSMLLNNYKDLTDLYTVFYKQGADAFNAKDYKLAYEKFNDVRTVNDYMHSVNSGMGAPMDTMAILNMSNAAFNAGLKEEAAKGYQQLADIKYKEDPIVYKVLLQYYREKKDDANYQKTLAVGKELFPSDNDFNNEEISYFNETGKQDELVKKLEESVQKDPSNYDMMLNLAITYDNMANPKDASGNSQAEKPANYDELYNKAIETYKKAIALKPEDYAANFNLGLMEYNTAAAVGKQLGQLGSSKEDMAKADSLSKQEDAYLEKALPYLEKSYQVLDAKDKLTQNEVAIYKNTLMGLQGIAARKNDSTKLDEYKQKLSAADSKAGQ